MSGDELRAALDRLGYSIAEGARLLKVNYTTLHRQASRGTDPIDGPYAAAVECWLKRKRKKRNGHG